MSWAPIDDTLATQTTPNASQPGTSWKCEASHQRSPRGRGGWLFELCRDGELAQGVDYFGEVGTCGLTGVGATIYGFALKAAEVKVREIGATEVVVLP